MVLLRLRHKLFPPYLSALEQTLQNRLFIGGQDTRWRVETSDKTLAIQLVDMHKPVLALLQLHTLVIDSSYMEHWELSSVPVLHSNFLRRLVEVDAVLVKTAAKAPVLMDFWQ